MGADDCEVDLAGLFRLFRLRGSNSKDSRL